MDRTIRALADPTRREILRVLREADLTAGELGALFPITGASVSHHLSVLKEAELVLAERNGRKIVDVAEAVVESHLLLLPPSATAPEHDSEG